MFSEKSISADGVINSKNWGDVCEVCLKSAYIEPPNRPSPTKKYKNEFTRKKFEEFYRKKAAYEEKKRSTQKANPDYELANIISSLATFHNSLNMANIWDLTVYQVHDTFARQRQKNISTLVITTTLCGAERITRWICGSSTYPKIMEVTLWLSIPIWRTVKS